MARELIDLLLFAGIVFVLLSAELIIHSVYGKYANTSSELETNGKETAERMLQINRVSDVSFGYVDRDLSDYYNPQSKTIYLSKRGAQSNTIAAIAIAAHETGHAIQDHEKYFMLVIRKMLAPICAVSSKLVWVAIILGIILQYFDLLVLGLILMGATILFQLVTLPVEFDASKRAMSYLSTITSDEEVLRGFRKVLQAAAWTYVASLTASLMQMARILNWFRRD